MSSETGATSQSVFVWTISLVAERCNECGCVSETRSGAESSWQVDADSCPSAADDDQLHF